MADTFPVWDELRADKLAQFIPGDYPGLVEHLQRLEGELWLQNASIAISDQDALCLFYTLYLWALQIDGQSVEANNVIGQLEGTGSASNPDPTDKQHEMPLLDKSDPTPGLSQIGTSPALAATIAAIKGIQEYKFSEIAEISNFPWVQESPLLDVIVRDCVSATRDKFYDAITEHYATIKPKTVRVILCVPESTSDNDLLQLLNSKSDKPWTIVDGVFEVPRRDRPAVNLAAEDLRSLTQVAAQLELQPLD